jgi:hypothetical protein
MREIRKKTSLITGLMMTGEIRINALHCDKGSSLVLNYLSHTITNCYTILEQKQGDHCVFCNSGSAPCTPIQMNKFCCINL